jgi:hypothetical protein
MGVKLRALNAKPGERNKLNAEYGPWYVLHQNGWGICGLYDGGLSGKTCLWVD